MFGKWLLPLPQYNFKYVLEKVQLTVIWKAEIPKITIVFQYYETWSEYKNNMIKKWK